MDEMNAILGHDLMILEEMAANMTAYLDSDVVDWTMPRADMPRLTIGGYLMRQRRLLALRDLLSVEERRRLDASTEIFKAALDERVVRFEKRAHQELHRRFSEWIATLRDIGRYAKAEVDFYASVADTRVVIQELVDILQTPPYELQEGVSQELEGIDQVLKQKFSKAVFIWDPVWQPAYPQDVFWWLYGCPRS